MKKKAFNISTANLLVWDNLVEIALIYSDSVKFNILYQNDEFENLIKDLGDEMKIEKNRDKFYSTGNVICLSLANRNNKLFDFLNKFDYWKNKFMEDPSFWIKDNEILACITHENLIMVDIEYFGIILKDLDLYDVPILEE